MFEVTFLNGLGCHAEVAGLLGGSFDLVILPTIRNHPDYQPDHPSC